MKLIWLQLALGLFQADLAVKHEIDTDENEEKRPERELLGGAVRIKRLRNYGMAGGRFSGHMSSIIKFSGIMTLAGMVRFLSLLPKNGHKLQKAGYALLTGGALSNLYDRCKKGYVVDYVSFRTPFQRLNRLVFNLSDFFIMAGALLICFGQTEKTRG
ncbi:MAG: signal peptidase II [Lachnospiraceae bacterium]|jgi:Lipoprotein signal peptidase|nr:signal peptidase II [Lachnospiraceae bacterium]MCI9659129.1 signal peptidase II [Lachnospiraceae bacterium]